LRNILNVKYNICYNISHKIIGCFKYSNINVFVIIVTEGSVYHAKSSSASSSICPVLTFRMSSIPKKVFMSWPLRRRCETNLCMKLTKLFPLLRMEVSICSHSVVYQSLELKDLLLMGSMMSTDSSPIEAWETDDLTYTKSWSK